MKTENKSINSNKLRRMTFISMMTAVSVILYFIGEIPIIPGVPHLKIDLSDIPAMIAAIITGPIGGITVELLKNLIHLMRSTTYGLGDLANFVVGVALVIPFSLVYRKAVDKKSVGIKSITIGCVLSVISIVVVGLAINALIYPIYMNLIGNPIDSTAMFVTYLGSTVVMNLIKAGVVFIPSLALMLVLEKRKTVISV